MVTNKFMWKSEDKEICEQYFYSNFIQEIQKFIRVSNYSIYLDDSTYSFMRIENFV